MNIEKVLKQSEHTYVVQMKGEGYIITYPIQDNCPICKYIEENKDKGIFEYTESYLFDDAYKKKYKEIQLFKQNTLNACILQLQQDNVTVFEVQTTVDEAQNIFLNKRNQTRPFYYFIRNENITIKNIPQFIADEGYNLCEDYRSKRNYVVNNILLKKLADCKTVEQIESIEFVEGQKIILAGEIFILSPLIIPIEKTPEMNIVPTEITQENILIENEGIANA